MHSITRSAPNFPTTCLLPFAAIRRAPTLTALAWSLCCVAALAQPSGPSGSGTGGSLGLGIATAPTYQGADTTRQSAIPLLDYRWSNGMFAGGRGLLGMQFSKHPKVQYGVVLGYDLGRKQDDSHYLKGMGDIASSATFGGFVSYNPTQQISLGASHRHGAGKDHKGLEMEWSAGYAMPVAPGVQLSLSVGFTAANAAYMQSYFGVDAAQASASGYKRHTPGAGLRDTKASLGVNYQITQDWALTSGIMFTALSDKVSESPLVRKANSSSAFVGVVRRF